MPRIEKVVTIQVPIEDAFALSQSQGEVRYAWDPFVREQRLLDGALHPGKGVRTFTRSRHNLTMVTEYTSYKPPAQVGMKLVKGPPFFSTFGGGWSFIKIDESTTQATWRYTFTVKPKILAGPGERIGIYVLGRDIEQRIEHFAKGCTDPGLVERAKAQLGP